MFKAYSEILASARGGVKVCGASRHAVVLNRADELHRTPCLSILPVDW